MQKMFKIISCVIKTFYTLCIKTEISIKRKIKILVSVHTVLKTDGFNKFPCGHISLCPCQTLGSRDIRMSFGLFITAPSCSQFSVKVLGFSDVCKTANFQVIEL